MQEVVLRLKSNQIIARGPMACIIVEATSCETQNNKEENQKTQKEGINKARQSHKAVMNTAYA